MDCSVDFSFPSRVQDSDDEWLRNESRKQNDHEKGVWQEQGLMSKSIDNEDDDDDTKKHEQFLQALNQCISEKEQEAEESSSCDDWIAQLAEKLQWPTKDEVEQHARRYLNVLQQHEASKQQQQQQQQQDDTAAWSPEQAALFDVLVEQYHPSSSPAVCNSAAEQQDNWTWISRVAAHFPQKTSADIWCRWYNNNQQQ